MCLVRGGRAHAVQPRGGSWPPGHMNPSPSSLALSHAEQDVYCVTATQGRDRIAGKAHGGRGRESAREEVFALQAECLPGCE